MEKYKDEIQVVFGGSLYNVLITIGGEIGEQASHHYEVHTECFEDDLFAFDTVGPVNNDIIENMIRIYNIGVAAGKYFGRNELVREIQNVVNIIAPTLQGIPSGVL